MSRALASIKADPAFYGLVIIPLCVFGVAGVVGFAILGLV